MGVADGRRQAVGVGGVELSGNRDQHATPDRPAGHVEQRHGGLDVALGATARYVWVTDIGDPQVGLAGRDGIEPPQIQG
ncbi:hypothetical protein GCM10010176_057670 [Nonomuraea spiralis]|nr:hypothetical protein GCM10010176_057670 [Nonomuraea spiralis]